MSNSIKSSFLVFLFLLISTYSISKDYPFDPKHGIGFIIPTDKKYDMAFRTILPNNKITIYDKPYGKKVGSIIKEKKKDIHDIECSYYSYKTLKNKIISTDLEYKQIDYSGYGLKIYQKKRNHLLVLFNTIKNGVWISINELKKFNFVYKSYIQFLMYLKKPYNVSHYLMKIGLNLRTGPSIRYKKIVLLKDDLKKRILYNIYLTRTIRGLWAFVHIEKVMILDDDYSQKIIKKYKGWIKVLDNKFYPNIWYPPKGRI